jgi:hypothetical protein
VVSVTEHHGLRVALFHPHCIYEVEQKEQKEHKEQKEQNETNRLLSWCWSVKLWHHTKSNAGTN